MKRTPRHIISSLVVVLATLLVSQSVSAHTPVGSGGNESLATAMLIKNPLKSWAIYADLHEGGEAQYYQFEVNAGQLIHVMLFTTATQQDATFTPGIILFGPGIANQDSVPDYVEIPPQAGWLSINGKRASQASYEPFAPSAFVILAEINVSAPESGKYHVVVHASERGGNYGLAIGDRESFTISEWLLMPFALLSVYTWGHQSLAAILTPAIIVASLGFILLVSRHRAGRRLDITGWIAASAGLLFMGTGVTVVSQLILAINQSHLDPGVSLTLFYAVLQILLGILVIGLAMRRSGRWNLKASFYLILLGFVAFVFWAGFVIGPILAIAAAFVRSKTPPR